MNVYVPPRLTPETLALIKHFEGCSLKAYRDAVGVWTIGYGHTGRVRRGMSLTPEEAEQLLIEDLDVAQADVLHCVKTPLNDNEFGALVSLAFNIGGTALRRSTLVRVLNRGNRQKAAVQFERFVKGRVRGRRVTLKGLQIRRRAEREFFEAPPGTLVRNGQMVLAGRAIPVEHPSYDVAPMGPPQPPPHHIPLPSLADFNLGEERASAAASAKARARVNRATLTTVGAGAAVGAIPATGTPASQNIVETVTHMWERAGGPQVFPAETDWLRWLEAFRIGLSKIFKEGAATPLLDYAAEFLRSHEAMMIFAITALLFLYRFGVGGIFTSRDRRA